VYVAVAALGTLVLSQAAPSGARRSEDRTLVLTRAGKPAASIVVARQPTRAAWFAAAELQYHIEKISGARLPIVPEGVKIEGTRILMGESAATRVRGLTDSGFEPQEYLIRFAPNTLVLMGRDEPEPAVPVPWGDEITGRDEPQPAAEPPPFFDEQATCYAVYDFLERHCGVRWYGPTELCMVCPERPTLRVEGGEVRRAPAFVYRQPYPMRRPLDTSGMTDILWNKPSAAELNLFWHRLRAGGQSYACNHSFYGYYDRFWRQNPADPDAFEGEHPEFFAQGYEGKPPQMCYTNAGFIQQVVQDARDYFDGKGAKRGAFAAGDYFALVPMDNNQYCKCPTCQAEMSADEDANAHFSRGTASDYIHGFAAKVAGEVAKTHPDKYLATLAYFDYAYYPRRVRPEPNTSVQLCLAVRNWWAPAMARNNMRIYREWVERAGVRPLYVWLYYCFPSEVAWRSHGLFEAFPGFFAHTAARQIKMFHRDGVRGAFFNGLGEQVDTYVAFKLLDDPTLDVDRLLDEFFDRYYGPAGQPLKQMYLSIERTYSDPANYPPEVRSQNRHFHQTREMAWDYLGTEARMNQWARLMAQATVLAKTEPEKTRVALFEKAVWDHMVEGRRKHLARQAAEPEIAARKAQPPPSVRVPRIADAGGDVAKVEWPQGTALTGWRRIVGDPADRRIEGRIAQDGAYLYVQLQEWTDTDLLVNSHGMWGDSWQIHVAAQRARPYRRIEIIPNGGVLATCLPASGPGAPWESGARVVSDTAAPDVWTVRLALPLDRLLPGGLQPAGPFYANFFRAAYCGGNRLAWTPNFVRGFEELSRLGAFTLE